MTQQHPITLSPELVEQWIQEHATRYDLARHAAQWGADQELEACCEVLNNHNPSGYYGEILRTRRRPKPPSLKEQALEMLEITRKSGDIGSHAAGTIRRALEQLDD